MITQFDIFFKQKSKNNCVDYNLITFIRYNILGFYKLKSMEGQQERKKHGKNFNCRG